jgi:hypothetical protein
MGLCTQGDPVALPGSQPGTVTPGHGSSGRCDQLHSLNKFSCKALQTDDPGRVHRLPAGKLEPRNERQREIQVASKTLDKIHFAEQKALGATADLQQQQKEAIRYCYCIHARCFIGESDEEPESIAFLSLLRLSVAVDLPQHACDMPSRSRAGKRRRSARGLRSGSRSCRTSCSRRRCSKSRSSRRAGSSAQVQCCS